MHKYYVSITEAEYNVKNQTLEVSIKFIGHDLEHALENAGVPELYLGTLKEDKKANEYLKKYIDAKFQLMFDDKKVNFKFVGKEINNDDFIYCYLESDKIGISKKIEIKNSLLTEIFDEQANIMYLKIGDKKFNYNFTNDLTTASYSIKEK